MLRWLMPLCQMEIYTLMMVLGTGMLRVKTNRVKTPFFSEICARFLNWGLQNTPKAPTK
jgi:hypothetical protein